MNLLFSFGPVVEPYITKNCFIPKHPAEMAKEAWGNNVDLMIGACSNEGFFLKYHNKIRNLDMKEFLKNFGQVIPLELNVKFGSEKAKEYAKVLRKLYYGETELSEDNLQGYYDVSL